MSENTPSHPDLLPYIEAIPERFSPAETAAVATHRFSTGEVLAAIKELNPGIDVTAEHVFRAMILAGFRFNSASGTQSLRFQWLLIEK